MQHGCSQTNHRPRLRTRKNTVYSSNADERRSGACEKQGIARRAESPAVGTDDEKVKRRSTAVFILLGAVIAETCRQLHSWHYK